MRRIIYLDNASSTKMYPQVIRAMTTYLKKNYANPSGMYKHARIARQMIDTAREVIAASIGCQPTELIFTSSATEANNMAIFGVAEAYKDKGNNIIVSAVEHASILEPAYELKRRGYNVTFLPVDANGVVDVEYLKKHITKQTILVSVMFANNEVGTIQPVDEIGKICQQNGIVFHTDAVQAMGKIRFDICKIGAGLASFSSHKIHGPKGVGALYVRRDIKLKHILFGGGQEFAKRPGTENVAGIIGFGKAVEIANKRIEKRSKKIIGLRKRLMDGLRQKVGDVRFNAEEAKCLPGILSVRFDGVSAEMLLINLDQAGICASAGSACASLSSEISHTLLAMGLTIEEARSTIRFSLSEFNTRAEIDYVLDVLPNIVKKLRRR